VILSHPDLGDRYFTFEIADYFSDNFAYVGTRTTGGMAGNLQFCLPSGKANCRRSSRRSFDHRRRSRWSLGAPSSTAPTVSR